MYNSSIETVLFAFISFGYIYFNHLFSKMLTSKIITSTGGRKFNKALSVCWQNLLLWAICGWMITGGNMIAMWIAAVSIGIGITSAFFASPEYITKQAETERKVEEANSTPGYKF